MAQLPALQVACPLLGAAHTVPHVPQFDGEVRVSTHEPPQFVSVPQLVPHAPALQTAPATQALPQVAQFFASESKSTHAPLHSV